MFNARVVLAVLLLCASPAFATIYDVTCGAGDDTAAIQTAIDNAFAAGGGIVRIPVGTSCDGGGTGGTTPTAIKLKSNVSLEGFGAGSVLSHRSGTQFLIYVDSQSSAGTSTNIRNIAIRNLTLKGRSETDGFSQHNHLVSLNGVSDALIENVVFTAFQGDGLYLGSTSVYDEGLVRHNERVLVKNCKFDGVNKANRQGISYIDCSGCSVEDSLFTRTTHSTMPGAIDVEPDFDTQIVRDLKFVRNRFIDIGGNAAAINMNLSNRDSVPWHDFVIAENDFETTSYGVGIGIDSNAAAADPPVAAVIENNRFAVTTHQSIIISGVKGVRVQGNAFLETTHAGLYIGRDQSGNFISAHDVDVRNNLFYKCSTTEPYSIVSYTTERMTIEGNTFFDCGTSDVSETLFFGGGASSGLRVKGNSVVDLGSRTYTYFTSIRNGFGHTFSPETSTYFDNRIPDGFLNAMPSVAHADAGVRLKATSARPTCASTLAGLTWFTPGASGVEDKLELCAKDTGGTYAWRTVYP
jgi:hypothetical protein